MRTANDGLAGLISAGQFHPEIVFADPTIPSMDGFDLCKRLRTNTLTQNTAVFALSGSADPSDGRFAGFDACLRKPVEFEVIEASSAARRARCRTSLTRRRCTLH